MKWAKYGQIAVFSLTATKTHCHDDSAERIDPKPPADVGVERKPVKAVKLLLSENMKPMENPKFTGLQSHVPSEGHNLRYTMVLQTIVYPFFNFRSC